MFRYLLPTIVTALLLILFLLMCEAYTAKGTKNMKEGGYYPRIGRVYFPHRQLYRTL